MTERYVELRCQSAFSFLRGASLPEDLVEEAARLGYSALGLGDRDGVYGAPRFFRAAKDAGIRPLVGAEVVLESGEGLYLLVENRTGYKNLCRLLTRAKLGRTQPARGTVLARGWANGRQACRSTISCLTSKACSVSPAARRGRSGSWPCGATRRRHAGHRPPATPLRRAARDRPAASSRPPGRAPQSFPRRSRPREGRSRSRSRTTCVMRGGETGRCSTC